MSSIALNLRSCAFRAPSNLTRIIEVVRGLFSVFSPFGKVVDVVATKIYKLRGQAWIVFDSSVDAEKAMNSLQGFTFYDKPLVRRYA